MANHEALKELQMRLAARLQAAQTESVAAASWLAVHAGPYRLLLPLEQAGEIFPWPGVQPVPHTQPWFLGVANLRGLLSGVVDVAALLGAEQAQPQQAQAERGLLTLAAGLETNAALLIDRFVGLRGAEAFVAEENARADAPAYLGGVCTDPENARWQVLDLEALAQDPVFLNIGA